MKLDLNRIREVTKAIAGASAAGIGSLTTTFIFVPPDVAMPWYGHVIVGLANAALTYGVVYMSAKNAEPSPK